MGSQASPRGSRCWRSGWGVWTAGLLLPLFFFSLFCSVSLLSVHAEEEVREVVQEGAPFELDSSEGPPPHYTLSEVQEALETWWPSSSVFDFDAAYEAARKKAKRPLGVWGVEVEDRRELLRLLNLEMERFVAKEYSKLRASDPVLAQVSLLSDWNVLLLVRQQLTRQRVKTKLTDQQLDQLFEGAPRLYPWLPRDVCDWTFQARHPPLRLTFAPTCTPAEGP
ncbi:hypothetical protein Emed_001931 [Eimeria media]